MRSERLGNQPLVAKGKIMGDELITVYPPKNIYLEMFSKFPHYFQGDKKRQRCLIWLSAVGHLDKWMQDGGRENTKPQ